MAAAHIGHMEGALLAVIGDEDTVTGFLLAGVGHLDIRRKSNFLIVDSKTTTKQIETAYKEFAAREDIAVILINQYIANMIRSVINNNTKPVPATLEVPSKDCPYDPTQDSILARVQFMVGMN